MYEIDFWSLAAQLWIDHESGITTKYRLLGQRPNLINQELVIELGPKQTFRQEAMEDDL